MKIKNKNKIIFQAVDEYTKEVVLPPTPAKDFIPDWWKKMQPYTAKKLLTDNRNEFYYPHVSAKKCFPLVDAMTSGYILPLWADVEVSNVSSGKKVTWLTDKPIFDTWSNEVTQGIEYPEGYDPEVFKLKNYYVIKTPNNYSCLITHPLGFNDLPFKIISGVADTDKLKTIINPTLWWKKDFEGIVKKGTPMAQIIPFRRENWESQIDLMAPNKNYFNEQKFIRTVSEGAYGLFQRQKKNYT